LDETYAIANLLFIAAEAKGADGIGDKTLFIVAHSIMCRMDGDVAAMIYHLMRLCTNAYLWTGGHIAMKYRDRVGRAGVTASLRSNF
jgi:hypothetical protein